MVKKNQAIVGINAELSCIRYLQKNGVEILKHRYRNAGHEIDIIALSQDTLIFIEVKARPNITAGLEIISQATPEKYAIASQIFLSEHLHYSHLNIRFDAMIVTPNGNIHYVENIWGA